MKVDILAILAFWIWLPLGGAVAIYVASQVARLTVGQTLRPAVVKACGVGGLVAAIAMGIGAPLVALFAMGFASDYLETSFAPVATGLGVFLITFFCTLMGCAAGGFGAALVGRQGQYSFASDSRNPKE